MAHTKSGGSTSNLRDSNPQYLGVKLYAGQQARAGNIIVRQRGSKFLPGKGVRRGHDDTLYATMNGTVHYANKRKTRYDGKKVVRKLVSVV
jgi:large subunit ribosomal protein L27